MARPRVAVPAALRDLASDAPAVAAPARGGGRLSPDRRLPGSGGVLGVVTDAGIRVQRRPRPRAAESVAFATFAAGLAAVRAIASSRCSPRTAGCPPR